MDGRSRRIHPVRAAGVVRAGHDVPFGQLRIEVSHPAEGACLIEVVGNVDMMTSSALRRAVAQQCEALPSTVVLDLRGVRFLGSSGLASLMAARQGVLAIGGRLRLVCTGPTVLEPMEATGLAELFEVYPDADSALRGRLP